MTEPDRALRMQILSLENATLLQNRSQLWSDASSRATLFLAVLSGAVVALALGAQASAFDWRFFAFAVVLLPVVLYVGVISQGRLVELNSDDLRITQQLHRIQHGVLELDPDAAPYLAFAPHDDWSTLSGTYAQTGEITAREGIAHGLRTLPALFGVINSVVASALMASLAILVGVSDVVLVGLVLATFVVVFALQARTSIRTLGKLKAGLDVRFPAPEVSDEASAAPAARPDVTGGQSA